MGQVRRNSYRCQENDFKREEKRRRGLAIAKSDVKKQHVLMNEVDKLKLTVAKQTEERMKLGKDVESVKKTF